jgi:hypothetical protein
MKWPQCRWPQAVLARTAAWFGSDRHPPRSRRTLQLEALECRCVPSTITPTTFADGGLDSGSLRDALSQTRCSRRARLV